MTARKCESCGRVREDVEVVVIANDPYLICAECRV